MPELPEVETIRRGLSGLLIGKVVTDVVFDTPKSFPNSAADVENFLIGASVVAVRRRAKVLLIDLSSEYSLVIHLKMTGQMVYIGVIGAEGPAASPSEHTLRGAIDAPVAFGSPSATISSVEAAEPSTGDMPPAELRFGAGHPSESLIGELPDRSTRVTLTFKDGSHLYFNDQRKFGWMRLMPTLEVPNIDFMKRVGPEPLEVDFTAEQFAERFKRRANTTIKAALLDQSVIAGVGNIYADESLWGAKVHPQRLVKTITPVEFMSLYEELRLVMNLAIEKGGSTDKNYVNAEGKRGSYLDFARVFRREGQTCPRHPDVVIEKLRVAGRGTHICPVCQQL